MYQLEQDPDDFIGPPAPPTGQGTDWAKYVDALFRAGGTVLQYKTAVDTLKTQRQVAASQAERDAISLQIARLQQETERLKSGSIPSWVWMAGAGVGALVLVVALTRR